jgi:hypothetical protein
MNYEWDTSGLDKAKNKIDDLVEKIKAGFKAIFGEWDFDKIGKSIQKFAKQVQKFLEPIGKMFADIWTNYLRPFITWTGNELLPAFLKAVGGALELLGAVIGELWNAALKPFIDNFLVPIAQFTGGVIVGVLTGIGDALTGIASNSDAVYYLAQGVKLLIEAFAAYKIIAVADQAITNFINSMRIAAAGIPAQQAIIETGGGAFSRFGAAVGAAQSGVGGLTGILTGIGGAIFNPMTIAVGGTVLAMQGLEAITTLVKTAQIEATTKEREWRTAQEEAKNAVKMQTDAIERQKQLKEEIASATQNVTNATLAYMNKQDALTAAQKAADEKLKEYKKTMADAEQYIKRIENGDTSLTIKEREVAEAVLKTRQAEENLKTASEELKNKKGELKTKNEEYENQAWKTIMAQEKESAIAKLQKGDFEGLAQSLLELSKKELTYQDANGKTVTMAKEKSKDMADFIMRELGRIDDGQGKFWQMMVDKSGASLSKIADATKKMTPEFKQSGINFCEGIVAGLNARQAKVYAKAREMGYNANYAFREALRIQSPSRVMMEAGGFFAEGVAVGIEKKEALVTDQAAGLGTAMVDAFNSAPKFQDLGGIDLADKFQDLTAKAQGTLELQNETTNDAIDQLATAINNLAQQDQRVTVKIGEDTLMDKIIDGINNASTMRNQSVLNL